MTPNTPSGAAQAATPSTKMHCTIDTSEEFSALAKLTAQKIQRLGRWPNTVELERIVEAALARQRTALAAAEARCDAARDARRPHLQISMTDQQINAIAAATTDDVYQLTAVRGPRIYEQTRERIASAIREALITRASAP